MSVGFPSPTDPVRSRTAVFVGYLRYFRDQIDRRLQAMSAAEAGTTRLPSGWTPLELVWHLRFMERRWLVWGFEGQPVDDPWGDERDGRWCVPADLDSATVLTAWRDQAALSDAVIARHALDEVGRPGPRWDGAEPATLERVLFHVLQEYARHLGQLDIVAELGGGITGET